MDRIGYFEAMEAVKRIIIRKKNNAIKCKTSHARIKNEGEMKLYETILFYMEQCQKKTIKME